MKKVWFFLVLLTVFMVIITSPKLGNATSQELVQEQNLPTLGTVEKLRSILAEAENSRTLMGHEMVTRVGAGDVAMGSVNKSAQSSTTPAPTFKPSAEAEGFSMQVGKCKSARHNKSACTT